MRPLFHPFLVNEPFSDPALYINFIHEKRAVTCDLGDLSPLSTGDLMKISHVFVSHTHMDHFAGFDRLLRLVLGRDKTIHLFGPESFLDNITGKLQAYTWNLAANYENSLVIQATEIRSEEMITRTCRCQDRFEMMTPPYYRPFTGPLLEEPGFTVAAVILDHGIPCLGFCLKEHFHINIKKSALAALGLDPGPWLKTFKKALYDDLSRQTSIFVPTTSDPREFSLGYLADNICVITPGQKITWITDVAFTPENIEKIIDFARHSDHLFIEAYFLEKDRDIAAAKKHLTARQAGEIAGRAAARRVTTFHYSPRYRECRADLEAEARTAYQQHYPRSESKAPSAAGVSP